MKNLYKLLLILVLLMFTSNIIAQISFSPKADFPVGLTPRVETVIHDTVIIVNNIKIRLDYDLSLGKLDLQKYFDGIIKSIENNSVKASETLKTILNQIPVSQDACLNGGFEDGVTDWTGLSLSHPMNYPYTGGIENGLTINPGIVPLPFDHIYPDFSFPIPTPGNSVNLQGTGLESLLLSASPTVNLQMVISGNQSIKLGNETASRGAEGIAKRFVVTPQNSIFYFQYAIVMDKSHANPDGSSTGTEVFFIAEAVDMAGNTIDKTVELGIPNNPFINSVTINNGTQIIYYRDWRCCSLDLSGFIGQEVVVMFINADCAQGAHKGYTFLDAVCEPCTDVNEGYIDLNLGTGGCLTFPQTIEGTFTLPISGFAQNSNISLQIFQNNILVRTLTNPIITGSNYSFTLIPSDFPNQTNGQCYDLVSTLSFDYPDMNGQLQNVTQLSSNVVMGVQDGEINNLNNDVCFCSTGSICGMKFNDLNDNGVQDQGEPGLPNWTISLSGSIATSTLTDASGNYCFNNLPAGTYTVTETCQNDWQQTCPVSGTYTATLGEGLVINNLDFGNHRECVTPPPDMVAWWPLDEQTGAPLINDIAPPPASVINNAGVPMPGGMVGSYSIPGKVAGGHGLRD
jgi:hypothetical protein